MSRISSDMLSNTLNLVALARQTALAKGDQAQAEKVAPIENKLRDIVSESQQPNRPASGTTLMAQSDFKSLLAIKQKDVSLSNETTSSIERNQVISAMSAGGMADIDIARQMGISQEEVQLVINLGRRQSK